MDTQVLSSEICPFRIFTSGHSAPTVRAMNSPTHIRPVYDTRWRNFRAVLASRELSITAAAEILGKTQGQVSHFGGSRPSKVIGDQLAAEIEAAFNLQSGSLDWPDLNDLAGDRQVKPTLDKVRMPSQIEPMDLAIVTQAEKWVRFEEDALKRAGKKAWGDDPVSQPVRRLQRLIQLAQLLEARGGQLQPEEAAEIIDAVRQKGAGDGRKAGAGEA